MDPSDAGFFEQLLKCIAGSVKEINNDDREEERGEDAEEVGDAGGEEADIIDDVEDDNNGDGEDECWDPFGPFTRAWYHGFIVSYS